MESDITIRNKEIKNGAKSAFIFLLFNVGLSQLLSGIFRSVPSRIFDCICIVLATLIVMLINRHPEKDKPKEPHEKMTGSTFVVILGAFMLSKLLSMIPSLLFASLSMNGENAAALQDLSTVGDNLFLSFIFLGLLTPICEEMVFRGCIGQTYKKYGVWFAIIMSSILFALYHGNILQLFSTFLPGVVMFYVAMNYSIVWAILLHFINNGLIGIGTSYMQKYYPGSFITSYGEYILEGILILIALLLVKKNNSVHKVKEFFSGPKNEKGVYKTAMGNIWFILLILTLAAMTGLMFLMLNGDITAAIPVAQ